MIDVDVEVQEKEFQRTRLRRFGVPVLGIPAAFPRRLLDDRAHALESNDRAID